MRCPDPAPGTPRDAHRLGKAPHTGKHFSSISPPLSIFPFRTRPIPVSMHKTTFQSRTVVSCEMHPGSPTPASGSVICWQVPDLAVDEPRKLQQCFEVMQPQWFWGWYKLYSGTNDQNKSKKGVQGFVESLCLIKVSPAESCTTMESCNNPKWWHQHISRQGPQSWCVGTMSMQSALQTCHLSNVSSYTGAWQK